MTNDEIRTALEAISAKISIPCRCGNGGTLYTSPTVRMTEGAGRRQEVEVRLECNATITKKMAVEIINQIRREFAAVPGSETTLKSRKLGVCWYTHMGWTRADAVYSRHFIAQ